MLLHPRHGAVHEDELCHAQLSCGGQRGVACKRAQAAALGLEPSDEATLLQHGLDGLPARRLVPPRGTQEGLLRSERFSEAPRVLARRARSG